MLERECGAMERGCNDTSETSEYMYIYIYTQSLIRLSVWSYCEITYSASKKWSRTLAQQTDNQT